MRRGAAALAFLALSSGAASSQAVEALDLGPGSQVFWINNYDGGLDHFQEKLVGQAGDVGVYKNVYDGVEESPSEYFALFSGIYYITCDDEMPSQDEQDAMAALRPFEAGKTLVVASGNDAEIVIVEPTEFFLMGRSWPAHTLQLTYGNDDERSTETISVLDDYPLTVQIDWEDNSKDTAMLVTRSKDMAQIDADEDLIGNCAGLLKEQIEQE